MRLIIFLAGFAMSGSFFLTWIEMPFAGPHVSPVGAVSEGWLSLSPESPWQSYVFLASFALAAMAALTRTAFSAALAAAAAGAVIVSSVIRLEELRRNLGVPLEVNWRDLAGSWDLLSDFIRIGAWAYLGGAVFLAITALSIIASRR